MVKKGQKRMNEDMETAKQDAVAVPETGTQENNNSVTTVTTITTELKKGLTMEEPGDMEENRIAEAEQNKERFTEKETTAETADFAEDIQLNEESIDAGKQKEGNQFSSTSQELRKRIEELLMDGESYSKKMIVEHLNQMVAKGYSEACLINVLRNMVADGSLMQVERGSYMKGNGLFKSRLHKYLLATRSGLKKACTLNASEMEEADFEIIKQIKAVECDLDVLMDTLEKLGA